MGTTLTNKTHTVSKLTIIGLGLLIVMSWLIVSLGNGVVPQVVNLYSIDFLERPYFQLQDAGLFYIKTPLIVASSLALWMLPGIFMVLAIGKVTRVTELFVRAFSVSFITYVLLISLVKLISPRQPPSSVFVTAVAISGVLAWCILAFRVFMGANLNWPFSGTHNRRRLMWVIFIPVVVLLTLFPLFFWQDMHDDGFEALEIGRSLTTYLLPRFPNPVSILGLGVGMIPMAYPIHWFLTLFGPLEVSARLPFLLYLPVLFALLIELIEWRSPKRLGLVEEALLVLGLGIFVVTMSYNSSYDPYFADIAAPTALETMTLVSILAAIYFLWIGGTYWFFFFAVLSCICRPTGFMILGLVFLSVLLMRPQRMKRWLVMIAFSMVLVIVITLVYDKVYAPFVSGTSDIGYQSGGVLDRIRYLRLIELSRLNYGLFPSGILPFLFLFAFRRQDQFAKMLAIVALSYFVFFFFQAYIALHHFVPIMVLPLVVFWRIYLHQNGFMKKVSVPVLAVTSLFALWLSRPQHFAINRTVRPIGQKTSLRIGDYDRDYRGQVKHAELFFELISPDWEVEDPSRELVSGYASLIYYASRPKLTNPKINYIVQPIEEQAPAGFTLVANDEEAALYIRDIDEWERDRFQELRTDYRSPIYDIPRTTLFYYRKIPEGQILIDLRRIAGNFKRILLGLFIQDTS